MLYKRLLFSLQGEVQENPATGHQNAEFITMEEAQVILLSVQIHFD